MTKVDKLIAKFKELKEDLNKNMNGSYSTQPNTPNPTTGTSGGQGGMYRSENIKKDGMVGQDAMAMSEVVKFDNNGQWKLDKADSKAKAKAPAKPAVKTPAAVVAAPAADPADPTDAANPDPAAAALAKDPADPVAPAAPAAAAAKPAAKDAGAGSGSGNSPTKTNTETGGSSPGGASTGGVGSGLGGAGTGGAATGGASTGGAGTVTVTISGSSSTETSSGAGAKKGKGKGGEPAAPITLNISNVGGRTDAGNVASGDGPGASGSGGHAPNGFGGGGGGASPDEPKNFSTQGKDKMAKAEVIKFEKNGQWSLDKAKIVDMKSKKVLADLPYKRTQQHSGIAGSVPGKVPEIFPMHTENEANIKHKHPEAKFMTNSGVKKCEELLNEVIEKLEKAKIVDMKSKKTLANLPYKKTPRSSSVDVVEGEAPRIFPGTDRHMANIGDKHPESGLAPGKKVNKVDPDENVNIPHPKGKAKMADGVNKEENSKLGTNQRLANPPEKACSDGRGKVHMVKGEGTNEEAASSNPHNKGKFKVMDEVKEKESKKEKVAGLPYNGDDKKVHKSEKVLVGTGTNDENTGPGRNSGHGAL